MAMNRVIAWSGVAVMAASMWCRAESVSIVQITDMRGQVGYQVMSREEFATLTKEVREETAAFPAIVAECKKTWDANKENKVAFQGSRVKPRTVKKMGQDFSDRDKAEKKRTQLEDRVNAKQAEEIAMEEKKSKASKPSDEEMAKTEAKAKAFDDAFSMISKALGDKIGRPVPNFGLPGLDQAKEAPAKDDKKEKKTEKKEKEEKKAGK
jgi:hypothetical protein